VKEFFIQVWADLKEGKNVSVYIAVFASFLVFFLRLFNVGSENITGKLLLLTVGLLLIELLRLKTSSENLVSAITSFDPRSHITALQGYPTLADMEKLFEGKTTISILTITCSQVKFDYLEALTKHLEAGGELRILTVENSRQVFDNIVYFGEDGNETDSMMINHGNILKSLMRSWDSYIKNGKCQIRMVSHIPPYRLILVKSKEGERTAILLPRPLAVTGKKFLACSLDGNFHKDRISYFENQFDILWNKAMEANPSPITGVTVQNARQLTDSIEKVVEVNAPSEILKG